MHMNNDQNEIVDKKAILVSVATGLVCAVFGLILFMFQGAYAEKGHDKLLMVYIIMAIILIIPVYFSKKGVISLLAIMMVTTLVYSWMKFDWRADYIKNAKNGNAFILETYIDDYPTFEDHYFPILSDKPQWVHFANDCYKPATKSQDMAQTCRSTSLIQTNYNINLDRVIRNHFRKMKTTAEMLQQGQLLNKEQYRRCLTTKRCAIIPLLPADAEGKEIDASSDDYIQIRRQFWSLVNDKEISPEICEFIDLCRVMRDQNVVPIERPGSEFIQ